MHKLELQVEANVQLDAHQSRNLTQKHRIVGRMQIDVDDHAGKISTPCSTGAHSANLLALAWHSLVQPCAAS